MRRMRLPKEEEREEQSPFYAKLERWTDKEMQLNMLHEEIVNKREALLRTQRNFLTKTGLEGLPISDTDAAIRNDKLLKEMKDLEESISEHQMEPPSPRLVNLQKNYWTMVNNTFPVWQKSQDTPGNKTATARSDRGSRSKQFNDLANV